MGTMPEAGVSEGLRRGILSWLRGARRGPGGAAPQEYHAHLTMDLEDPEDGKECIRPLGWYRLQAGSLEEAVEKGEMLADEWHADLPCDMRIGGRMLYAYGVRCTRIIDKDHNEVYRSE